MTRFHDYYSEDLLKGRMAECLVEDLLKKSGNKVYRFGYESVLQNLTQISDCLSFDKRGAVSEKLRSTPDFIVINHKKKPFFVEVKYRTRIKVYESDLKLIEDLWQAKVIMVTIEKPYFRILNNSLGHRNWISLVKDRDLNVNGEVLENFNQLVEKYYPEAKK